MKMHTGIWAALALLAATLSVQAADQQQPATPATVTAPAEPANDPKLTEVQRLKGAVLRLQIENESLRAQLASANLRAMQGPAQALEAEYLATTKAPPGSSWDWATMTPTRPAGVPAAKP